MGQLVNPIGFRVGYSPAWLWRDFWCVKSLYYSEYLYNVFFFRKNLDSDIHFFLQKNFGFCYSHFCIYKRLNRFYIGVYFYAGAMEHAIQTGVKFMLWGHWRKRYKDRYRSGLISKHARILLGQMFRFEKLGTVAWLFQNYSKPRHKIKRQRLDWGKKDISFTNYHMYKKWLKLDSGLSIQKLIKMYNRLYLWQQTVPYIVRYAWWDFWYVVDFLEHTESLKADTIIYRPSHIKNYRWRTVKAVGKLGHHRRFKWLIARVRRKNAAEKIYTLENWNYSKWSSFNFFKNEWKGWGTINRNINLFGKKKRRRGGYSKYGGGKVGYFKWKWKGRKLIREFEQTRWSTGQAQERRPKVRIFFPTSWEDWQERFRRKIKRRKRRGFMNTLRFRIGKATYRFRLICDNLIRIFANYRQNDLHMLDYMSLVQVGWGKESLLRLDWLWYVAKRLYRLEEKIAKEFSKPRGNKYAFKRFIRFYAPNALRSVSRNNIIKFTEQKLMYKAKAVLNWAAKEHYNNAWRKYWKKEYWRNNGIYKGYAVRPYNCNFSRFEKFQEYKEIHQYIRLKWFLNHKLRGVRYMLNRFGYISNKLYKKRKRPGNFFSIKKKGRKKLLYNLRDEWFKHPSYLQMFWPRVINTQCFLVNSNQGVKVDRRRVRWIGRRLFFSKNEVLKDFGNLNFLGFLPLMMRRTSKPVFTDALKVSKAGHFNASNSLTKYFEPLRRMLENRAYLWREHIFCFRAFYTKIYIEILRIFLYMEANYFSYKSYALGNLTYFKWLTSFPLKLTYYFLTNKDVTATMISRYIAIKLTQGFTIRGLVNPIIKELEYMQDINSKQGILGFKFKLGGRFRRRQRVSRMWILSGKTPFSTIDSCVEYCSTTVIIDHGAYTVKLWIFKPLSRSSSYSSLVI